MFAQSSAAPGESACTSTASGCSKNRAKREASTAHPVFWTTVGDDQPLSNDAIRALAALLLQFIEQENIGVEEIVQC